MIKVMKKRILYNILNEWRDEDMDDSPIDLDDINFEPTSSDMSDEPDLDDDEFALSSTQETSYEYFPKTRDELKEIVDMEIEKQGGVHVNLNMIDTSEITDMNGTFYNCPSLETLDVSLWDVSNVEDMRSMFDGGCTSLRTLDVSKWNVSKVKEMRYMFNKCTSLHTDTTMWKYNTNKIKGMYDNAPNIKHN